jgi:hypothetical protein
MPRLNLIDIKPLKINVLGRWTAKPFSAPVSNFLYNFIKKFSLVETNKIQAAWTPPA